MYGRMGASLGSDREAIARTVADELGHDLRTVIRVIAGLPVRATAAKAIRRALIERGLAPVV